MKACKSFTTTSCDPADLKRLRLELADFLTAHLGGSPVVDDAGTIVAEILDNVWEHGPTDAALEVRAEIAPGMLDLKFIDRGPAFNPVAAPPPDPAREIGGLGLLIVRSIAHRLDYERSAAGENILSAQIDLEQNRGC